MQYWKLGCRWGGKSEGTPLFYDLLVQEKMVIGWVDMDYGCNNIILLTDGFQPLGIAITKSERKSILFRPELEQTFNELKIEFSDNIYYYDADLYQLDDPNFNYKHQKGIVKIKKTHVLDAINYHLDIILNKKEMNKLIDLLKYKGQIILQGPPGTGKTRLAKSIADEIVRNIDGDLPDLDRNDIATFYYIGELIPTFKGNSSYIIMSIADDKIILSGEKGDIEQKAISFDNILSNYKGRKWNEEAKNGNDRGAMALAYHLYKKNHIRVVQFHPSYAYEDFVRGIVSKPNDDNGGVLFKTENKIISEIASSALKSLARFSKKNDSNEKSLANKLLQQHILIIDEINRANLSSVLGELIYGLEYRGEPVESMYAVDGTKSITLPPNLYIIGTMNTADRSVGHIDYAIRRRFAFVDILPKNLKRDGEIRFDEGLFDQVSKLFIADFDLNHDYSSGGTILPSSYMSNDFRPEDVWLGHSYFIDKREEKGAIHIRLKYEIKPILHEYVKDGILNMNAITEIEKLKVTI